jgi:hypothetical protein
MKMKMKSLSSLCRKAPTADPGPFGVLGHVYTPAEALDAASRLRDARYTRFDVLTPFPVHGMDEAMGLKRSWIPWVTAFMAGVGILTAQVMMVWIMVYDWPLNYGGKPFWAWPSFVPITFELMVLFSGVTTAVVAIWAGRRRNVPQPPTQADIRATSDRFVLWIPYVDPSFSPDATAALLREIGANGVRVIDREGNDVSR